MNWYTICNYIVKAGLLTHHSQYLYYTKWHWIVHASRDTCTTCAYFTSFLYTRTATGSPLLLKVFNGLTGHRSTLSPLFFCHYVAIKWSNCHKHKKQKLNTRLLLNKSLRRSPCLRALLIGPLFWNWHWWAVLHVKDGFVLTWHGVLKLRARHECNATVIH